MAVPYRVLEDLAAFDVAISERFRFRTIAVLCTDEASEVSSRFVRNEFALIDELTGPEILAVSLEEPRGGYWQYLNQGAESSEHDPHSVHEVLAELNRR